MHWGSSSAFNPGIGGNRMICNVIFANCFLAASEPIPPVLAIAARSGSPLNIANIGYRISSTRASQFFAIGLNATWVLAIVELPGVAKYRAMLSG